MLNFTINRWFGIIFRQPSYSTFCDRQTCCQIVSEYNYFKVGRVNFCLSRVWASRESTKANISSMTTLFKYCMKAMTHKLAMSERMTLHTRGWKPKLSERPPCRCRLGMGGANSPDPGAMKLWPRAEIGV